MVLHFVPLCISSVFSVVSANVLLQMTNHQNSWNLLVINPNSELGLHLSGFYFKDRQNSTLVLHYMSPYTKVVELKG
jgi:hypothetical protein